MLPLRPNELQVVMAVNPLDVRINIRFKNANQFVPLSIKEGMKKIQEAVERVRAYHSWDPGPTDAFGLEFDFWFETRRPDIDGPLKRTIDATTKALGFDDNRVDELIVHRWVGEPAIGVKVWTLPANRDPAARKVKPKVSTPRWINNKSP